MGQQKVPEQRFHLAFDEFMIEQEAAQHSPHTIKWYRGRLGKFLGWIAQQDIGTEDLTGIHINHFLLDLTAEGYAPQTIYGYAQVVKTFCRFLYHHKYVSENPMQFVKMPKVPKVIQSILSRHDVRILLGACENPRDRAALLFLIDTGVRAAEFARMRVKDVEMDTGIVHVHQGKGGKDRLTYLGTRARRMLVQYYRERGDVDEDDPLWISYNNGDRLTHWGLRQMIQRLSKRTGIYCTPHTFRRTCAVWAIRSGMGIFQLQVLLGHEDIGTTRRYVALVDEDVREAHKKFGPVDTTL